MRITKEETREHRTLTCVVNEHDHPSQNLSYATALINGRYPESGDSVNLECEQILFVISGHGLIRTEGKFISELIPQDSYYIPKATKYHIEGDNLFMGVINTPRWTPEQCKVVD